MRRVWLQLGLVEEAIWKKLSGDLATGNTDEFFMHLSFYAGVNAKVDGLVDM